MLWYVALGSAVGGVARYLLGGWVQRLAGGTFPWGTLLVNLSGSFLLGLVIRYALDSTAVSAEMRTFLTIGVCGGYTTFGERDKHAGRPLHEAILHLLRERHLAGATVLRAIAGFGATARLHTDKVLRLSVDLPIVIECVDTEEKINTILPELDAMIGGGLITLEKVRVIAYRPET